MSLQEVGSIIGPRNGDTDLNIQTQGSGSHQVSIADGANNQDIARFHEGTQNVNIPNGNLDITGSLSVGGTECPADEALLGDGTCGSIGGGGGSTQNLSEVLAAGNVANQTIEFSNGIEIGDSSTAVGSNTDSVAVGKGADASTYRASAFGTGASASGTYSLAAGYNALASAHDGSAFGPAAEASGGFGTSAFGVGASATKNYASAFGSGASALANGSVAIGNNAKAPNQYEATFGNLNGDELDVNVTGDLTVHGNGGLDMEGNEITNVAEPDSGDDAANKNYVDNNTGRESGGAWSAWKVMGGSPTSLTCEAGEIVTGVGLSGRDTYPQTSCSQGASTQPNGDVCIRVRCTSLR